MGWVAKLSVFCAILLGACSPRVPYTSGAEETRVTESTSGFGTTTTSTTSTTTGPVPTSTSTDDDGPATTNGGFIETTDAGPDYACDLWTGEPCGEGEKCMPWDNSGGSSWNASKCSPLAPDPAAPGEPCTVQGSGVSGVDDCEAFSMCWDVDPETNTGTCVAFCTGSEANPMCEEPCTTCRTSNALILCLPICDPLLQNCGRGKACYPFGDSFMCVVDSSGDTGTAGDSCSYLNHCDPGLFCANDEAVDGCTSSQGCCAPFCTVGSFDACAGLSSSTECVPYYANPPPPSQCLSEDIGICVVPG